MSVAGGDVETDDIHVALEYKKGDVWGNYVTPRSNRYWLEQSLAGLVNILLGSEVFLPCPG